MGKRRPAPLAKPIAPGRFRRFSPFLYRSRRSGNFFPTRQSRRNPIPGPSVASLESPEEEISVESWRGDQDLLTATGSGTALPVGDLHVRRFCHLNGTNTPLATLHGGAPLLARVPTDHGGLYFCTSTVAPADSRSPTDGVVLFVALQACSLHRFLCPRQNHIK